VHEDAGTFNPAHASQLFERPGAGGPPADGIKGPASFVEQQRRPNFRLRRHPWRTGINAADARQGSGIATKLVGPIDKSSAGRNESRLERRPDGSRTVRFRAASISGSPRQCATHARDDLENPNPYSCERLALKSSAGMKAALL
jgi:hypothetical protein